MKSHTAKRSIIGLMVTIVLISGADQKNPAYAATQNQTEPHTISGPDLNNNPLVAKILAEIEASKKQVALLQKNQHDAEINSKFIAEQRVIAKNLQDQALQILQMESEKNSSKSVFSRFVSTVQDNNTKLVFLGQFEFTNKRIDSGHLAMKKILDNGGTYEQAIQEFSKYAAIKRVEMIELNKNLNIKYGLADPKVQSDFNVNGMLPDDYIKVPSIVTNHAKS